MMSSLPIDPGDLYALKYLLEERHVTRAANKLGVSQSSMSHRLAKLRSDLGDALLVPQGSGLVLTPRAQAMAQPLGVALEAVQAAISPPRSFDPAAARLEASLMLPDLLAPFLPKLMATLRAQAPGIQLKVLPVAGKLSETLSTAACDVAIAPQMLAGPNTLARPIGALRFGVFLGRSHPACRGRLTLKRWLAAAHVVVSVDNPADNPIAKALAEQGHERVVGLTVPGFLAGLLVVAESDMLMNAPLPLAADVAGRLELVTRPLPIALAPVRLSLLWHPRNRADPAHAWLREQLHGFFVEALAAGAKPRSRGA